MTTPKVREILPPNSTHGHATQYRSQAARDAQACGYGGASYWDYLDDAAQRAHDYWARHGDSTRAAAMLTRSLGAALAGNQGA